MENDLIGKHILVTLLLTSMILLAKDVKIVMETTQHDAGTVETTTMIFNVTHLHMVSKTPENHTAVYFDGAKNELTVANMSEKTKFVITEEKLQQMRGGIEKAEEMRNDMMNSPQMKEAMAKMQERMSKMSKEEQAVAKKYMPGFDKMEGMGEKKTEQPFEAVGSTSYNSWLCKKYERESEAKREVVLAAEFSQLNLSTDDFIVFKKMGALFENLGPQMGDQVAPKLDFASDEAQARRGYKGVPVMSEEYRDGKLVSVSKVLSAGYFDATGNTYKVPANLKEDDPFQKMPGMSK